MRSRRGGRSVMVHGVNPRIALTTLCTCATCDSFVKYCVRIELLWHDVMRLQPRVSNDSLKDQAQVLGVKYEKGIRQEEVEESVIKICPTALRMAQTNMKIDTPTDRGSRRSQPRPPVRPLSTDASVWLPSPARPKGMRRRRQWRRGRRS